MYQRGKSFIDLSIASNSILNIKMKSSYLINYLKFKIIDKKKKFKLFIFLNLKIKFELYNFEFFFSNYFQNLFKNN